MTGNLHTVHVRVNDPAGQATPVRIRFETGDGTYLAPFGRLAKVPTGWGVGMGGNVLIDGKAYAYIDGSCEIQLPADAVSVEITKGPEYVPIRQQLQLAPGKMALRFALSRWIDLRSEGWYSGDIAAYFLTPHAALIEGAAEDLAVVNLLARVWPCWEGEINKPLFPNGSCEGDATHACSLWIVPNILEFSGQQPAVQTPGTLVVVNTFNRHGILGSLALLNCHRVVYPLAFGGPLSPDNWTLAAWCDQCHRKDGLVVSLDEGLAVTGGECSPGEGLADLILGKVDAVAVHGGVDSGIYEQWYALLNCGLRATPVAGSSKARNLQLLGTPRTYAHLQPGADFTYMNWIEAVRAGRTFITNGPLLRLTVNGAEPGMTVNVTATVRVRIEACSLAELSNVEVVYNGQVLAESGAPSSPSQATIEGDLVVSESGWLAARCVGTGKTYAHTAPVYLRANGKSMTPDPEALGLLRKQLEHTLNWVESEARFEHELQREQLTRILHTARQKLDG